MFLFAPDFKNLKMFDSHFIKYFGLFFVSYNFSIVKNSNIMNSFWKLKNKIISAYVLILIWWIFWGFLVFMKSYLHFEYDFFLPFCINACYWKLVWFMNCFNKTGMLHFWTLTACSNFHEGFAIAWGSLWNCQW